jgi:hypothetical protein
MVPHRARPPWEALGAIASVGTGHDPWTPTRSAPSFGGIAAGLLRAASGRITVAAVARRREQRILNSFTRP